ncbi:hypothetical protein [Sinorhizobium meliloti]|uniref:hypothetical protein n=1 Tax=Rhizobium meliloti TaxID=382 RepID=UPI0003051FD1|nr:hypothetical protein [Sinorhizobium meliloti]MDE3767584.1 hypothetical protein [Sinorhizobium meliloti]MDE3779783.1 hypothetical protein [Sinorhizobium meliloti]MDE3807408.1 hypothetical protein [Sinorhizobium meliloti]
MNSTFKSPFEGEPQTSQIEDDNGKPAFVIRARELTANRARLADGLSILSILCCWAFGADKYMQEPLGSVQIAMFAVIPVLLLPLWRKLWRWDNKKETQIVLSETALAFRTGKHWNQFDRQLPHRFVLLPHDKAQAERDQNEYDQKKASFSGKAIMPVRYYGNSFIVCFEYLGQRNDILEVFGPKEAQAILTRLNACDSVMDAQSKKGSGTTFDPSDEWSDQPGDIRTPA